VAKCELPVGPDGQEVSDAFTFVHRSLDGDGSITVRVAGMRGVLPDFSDSSGGGGERAGLAPWAKAGLMIKNGTDAGAGYAAIMTTGAHGVRMQHDFTHDTAGSPGAAPRWLRLVRAGDVITGQESPDGQSWTTVAEVRLKGLPAVVQAGMFATSPQYSEVAESMIGVTASGGPSEVTGEFDNLSQQGNWPAGAWIGDRIGGTPDVDVAPPDVGGPVYQVTGSGDIAPAVSGIAGLGVTITQTLVGTFVALIAVVVLGAVFVSAEYRRGMVRTTLAAAPRRGRVLAAKAVVLGASTFLIGLVAAVLVV
jgi:regulation of enolase protein 1 (concanavalin A-like superfamily)